MFHHMLNCTMTHKNRVSLVIKDYKLIEEFPDSDFFGPYKVKKSKLSGRICFKENSRTLKKLFRHYQPPSSSDCDPHHLFYHQNCQKKCGTGAFSRHSGTFFGIFFTQLTTPNS